MFKVLVLLVNTLKLFCENKGNLSLLAGCQLFNVYVNKMLLNFNKDVVKCKKVITEHTSCWIESN